MKGVFFEKEAVSGSKFLVFKSTLELVSQTIS